MPKLPDDPQILTVRALAGAGAGLTLLACAYLATEGHVPMWLTVALANVLSALVVIATRR